MTDLAPLTALGRTEPRRATYGALELRENADVGFASLALRGGQAAPTPFGLTLPDAGALTAGANVSAFWTGRGQWMIEGEGRATQDFAATVATEAPGCSVTEQTDGFAAIEIASNAAAAPIDALLSKLVNIDPRRLAPGAATRTGLEHMTVFVLRRADDRLAVIGMRSLAGSLWHAIETAARRMELVQ